MTSTGWPASSPSCRSLVRPHRTTTADHDAGVHRSEPPRFAGGPGKTWSEEDFHQLVSDLDERIFDTLTRLAAGARPGTVVRLLDDPATLNAAHEDPTDFVGSDGLLVIDEVQLAPELLRPIKLRVDLDPTPGRYLLTGSSQVLALRTL